MTAIAVRDLRKSYGGLEAVRGISFGGPAGQVFGLLGPNGAGKTTTVEILEGYPPRRWRSRGSRRRPGCRGRRLARADRVVLQSSAMYETLTVTEMLNLFAGYYREPRPADEVVELVGLEEKRDNRVRLLSGRPAPPARPRPALVGDPELIFLDEPTTGFDPGEAARVGDDPRAAQPRQDDPADDALPRRGRAAGRPRRGPAPGRDRRLRRARRADRLCPADGDSLPRERREVVLHTDEPTRLLHS
jgi:ABC-2 type transport system ATP-binding protein